jgi:hypothetical protein
MDGTLIAKVPLATVTLGGTNILFGQSDINTTASTDANRMNLLFGLIDNIVVEALAPTMLTGDFNKDGNVDAADYVMWVKDNSVGTYEEWVEHFGDSNPGSGAAAAPEPGMLATVIVSLLAAGCCSRRRD